MVPWTQPLTPGRSISSWAQPFPCPSLPGQPWGQVASGLYRPRRWVSPTPRLGPCSCGEMGPPLCASVFPVWKCQAMGEGGTVTLLRSWPTRVPCSQVGQGPPILAASPFHSSPTSQALASSPPCLHQLHHRADHVATATRWRCRPMSLGAGAGQDGGAQQSRRPGNPLSRARNPWGLAEGGAARPICPRH